MNDLLRQLTEAAGVSGAEKEVRLLIRDLIADHVDEWSVDTMGNLVATKRGTGESDLRVLVDAHMDEVGLLVIDIDSGGMLKFTHVGGFDDRALLGKVVQVGPKKITGVIGARAIHLLKRSEFSKVVKIEAMRIDIGAKSEIYELINRLAADGAAVIVISSDLEEILRISDRVAVMHEGNLTGVLHRAEASEEAIMRLAVGHSK